MCGADLILKTRQAGKALGCSGHPTSFCLERPTSWYPLKALTLISLFSADQGTFPYHFALKQEKLILSAHVYSFPVAAVTNDSILKAETGQMNQLTDPNTRTRPRLL